jgi:hypothetical protein
LMKRVGSDKTPFLHILPVPALLALALTFIALACQTFEREARRRSGLLLCDHVMRDLACWLLVFATPRERQSLRK